MLDSLYCGKLGKLLKAYNDLDLDLTMLDIELVPAISYATIYSNLMFPNQFLFELVAFGLMFWPCLSAWTLNKAIIICFREP